MLRTLLTGEFLNAAKTGNLGKVKELLTSNPTLLNSKTENGLAAIVLARYHGHKDVADYLLTKNPALNINEAATAGANNVARDLLKKDPSLANSYSPDGFTPLHLAVFFGNLEIAKLLVEAGADVNAEAKNSLRVRPLHSALAGEGNVPEVAKLLLGHGAEVNVQQEGGATPLHEAAQSGNAEVAELLLKHGAEVNAKIRDGRTPLAMTREEGREAGSREDREKTARILLQYGATG